MKLKTVCMLALAAGLGLCLTLAVVAWGTEQDTGLGLSPQGSQDVALYPVRGTKEWDQSADIGFTPVATIYLPLTTYQALSPIYVDRFEDPTSGWPVDYTVDVVRDYVEGEYQIQIMGSDMWAVAASPVCFDEYVMAADVRVVFGGSASHGLAFGISDDWSQFYTFEIDIYGVYVLSQYSAGTWTTLDLGFGDSILPGDATNRLMVERNGDQITAYINGDKVTSISDDTYTGPRWVGLTASAYDAFFVDVRFDNFEVYPLDSGSEKTAQSVPLGESGAAGVR